MSLFDLKAKTDIAFISGFLRITINHSAAPLRLAFDIGVGAWVFWSEFRAWSHLTALNRGIFVLAFLGALADIAYQISGAETIEFGPEGLRIRRNYLGWDVARNYPLDKCSELSWQPDKEREHGFALECKVGWKKVKFGKYLSEAQAWEVLAELQKYLPAVAQKMGMTSGELKTHITKLGLS